MPSGLLLWIGVAIVAALIIYWVFPQQTEAVFEILWRVKGWTLALLGLAFLLAFISTGNPFLVTLGVLGIMLMVWHLLFNLDPEVQLQ